MTTSVELVAQANGLLSDLRFSEAEVCLEKAIALDASSVPALVGLGRLALLGRRLDDALKLLDRALSLQPDCPEAVAFRGVYWMQRGQFDRAIETLEQARAMDPSLAMVCFNLGQSYREVGQFAPAEASLRKAIELKSDHFEAYSQLSDLEARTGRLKDAVVSMLRAIQINPRYLKGYVVLESLCARAGKQEFAVRLYGAAIQRNPDAFLLRERLCSLYASTGDFGSAFKEAGEIVKRRNLYTDQLRLGTYAVSLCNFPAAEQAFQASIEINPVSWEGHYNLAEIYMSARLMDQAREQYQAALDKNSDAYEPLNGIGLFVLIVDQDCNRAIGFLREAIEFAPSRPEPRLNLALAYAKNGDFPASRNLAGSVLPLANPGDPVYDQAERLQGTIRIASRPFQVLE